MEWLIWPGAIVALCGVVWLLYCIQSALKIRAAKLDGDELDSRLQRLAAMNMGALAVSAVGLMMVVVGLLLG